MKDTRTLQQVIESQENILQEIETILLEIVEEMYSSYSLEEEEIKPKITIQVVKKNKFILEDKFIHKEMPPRRVKFNKERIKDYERMVSDTKQHITILKEALNRIENK